MSVKIDILEKTKIVMEKVTELNVQKGEMKTTSCPLCEGNLTVSKASCNGHIRVFCDKCKFSLMS